MKNKSKQESKSVNTYGWQTPPTTAAQTDYDNWAKSAFNNADPNIPYAFDNMRETLNNRIENPFGPEYSPEVADAIKYGQNQDINQAQGQATREDAYNRQIGKGGALATSAQMHAPVLVQTGGSSSGTTTTNPGFGNILMSGIGAGASLGSAAMT